jgi:hypothetical protein
MIRVRLTEDYPNWYWNSGNGVTVNKENRAGVLVDEDNKMVRLALDQGFLELVTEEELMRVNASKIITDIPSTEKSIKEVVTPENTEQLEKVKSEGLQDDNTTDRPSNQAD